MSLKSLSLAVIGGGAAYVLLKAAKAAGQTDDPQTVYVQYPAPEQSSSTNKLGEVLPFLDLGLSLLTSVGGESIFGGASGSTAFNSEAPQTLTISQGGSGTQTLLDMIARYEGGVNGYDVVYGGSKIQPPRPITQMTVQEVRNWQDQSVAAGSASSAVGKYQIIRATMDTIIASGTIRRGELFDVECQERAGRHLLEKRGYSDFQNGTISEVAFAQNLSKEWASLPAVTSDRSGRSATGQSYYAGDGLNSAHYSIGDLMNAVRAI